MAKCYLIPPIKSNEPFIGGFGNIPSRFMIVIPEAPLTTNGLFPTTDTQIQRFLSWKNSHLKEIYVTPLVKHRRSATAKTLYVKDIRQWLPILYQEIDLVRPERILVMGKHTAKALIPNFNRLDEDHGTLFPVKGSEINQSLSHLPEMIIMPTFSFNDLRTNLLARDYFQNDMRRFSFLKFNQPQWSVCEKLIDIPLYPKLKVTIDIESDSLDINGNMHMTGVGYQKDGKDHLFIVHEAQPDDITAFLTKLNDLDCINVYHNSSFDMSYLMTSSNHTAPLPKNRIQDPRISSHLSGVKQKGLKHLTSLYTELPGPHSGGSFYDEQYLAEDLRSTLHIMDHPEINLAKGTYADDLYHDLATILVKMRLRGVYIDRDKILEILVNSEKELASATEHLNSFVPQGQEINWNSTQQVVELFKDVHNVPLTAKTPAGSYSVAEGVLKELVDDLKEYDTQFGPQIEMINALLGYRSWEKLVSGFLRSYLDKLDDNGLVYPNLKLLGTETGRLSCADPNLQQIPRVGDFKLSFVPRWHHSDSPGYYGLVDFAGAELRMAAIISGDKQMAEFILSGDPHSHMARLAFPNHIPKDATNKEIKEHFAYYRKASKSTTFGKMYGGSNKGIAHTNSLPVENVAAVEVALRKEAPDLMRWLDMIKAKCIATLRVETIFGNQRSLKEKMLYEGKGGVARAGCNMPIQGSASILALVALRKLHNLCEEHSLVSRPIFTVHDSIISEIAEHELELYAKLTQEAYMDIENSPIVDYPVYHMLPVEGDLEIARNWAGTESTSDHTNIIQSIKCSSKRY